MLYPDETEPLLGAVPKANRTAVAITAIRHYDDDNDGNDGNDHNDHSRGHYLPRLTTRQLAVLLSTLSIFLAVLATNTMLPAINSLIENILCRQLFGNSAAANDPRCKVADVQRRLAAVRGWQTAAECIPAVLFTIPYGIMADKVGRKPVILTAYGGLVLQLSWYLVIFYFADQMPIWTVYLSALFACIGSFFSVGPAMIYTILADVTPQAERASCYFLTMAVFLVSEMLSSPLGGALLLLNGWAPLLAGVGIAIVSVLILLPLPETLGFNQATGAVRVAADSADSAADDVSGLPAKEVQSIWRQFVCLLRTDALETWRFIFSNRRIMLLMSSFVFYTIGRFVQELLLQYATKRYQWSWSRAAFLLTIRSTSNLLLFIVILPAASIFLINRLGLHPLSKDLILSRISGVFGVLGALMIAFAITPWMLSIALVIFSMGSGFTPLMRSLLSTFIEPHHQAMLNSMLGLFEFSGLMVTGPVLYGALQKGLDMGGLWVGLPFIYAAVITSLSTIIVCAFHIPPAMLAPAREDAGAEEAVEGEGAAAV